MTLEGLKVRCDFCEDTVMLLPGTCWDDWMEELHHDRMWRSQKVDGRWLHACVQCKGQLRRPIQPWRSERRT